MKRYLISTITGISILCMALSAYGQEQEKARQKENPRKILQNMTEEEKRQYRAKTRQKIGIGRLTTEQEEQLKAIETIQEQLVKLKIAISSFDNEAIRKSEELPEDEKIKFRENMAKAVQARHASILKIDEQLALLRGPAPRKTEPLMPIRELKVIREIAIKENATETSGRIEKMLNRYHSELKSTYEIAQKEKAKQAAARLKRLTDRFQKELIVPKIKEPAKTPEQQVKGPVILESEKQPKGQPAKQGSK